MEKPVALNSKRLDVLDLMRGIAILMVVFYHSMEVIFGPGFLIVPRGVVENLGRLVIFKSGAWWNFLENIFGVIFAYGFAAVNVFVMLSGLVLTWGMLHAADKKTNWLQFYWKKLRRILVPFYIAVVMGFLLLAFRNWYFPALNWWPNYSWFDWLKYALPPFLFFDIHWIQQLEGNYWYITLIFQFYLIFPLLFWLSQKIGVKRFLLVTFLLTVGYRLMATFGYGWLKPWLDVPYLDSSPMGVITTNQNSYFGFAFFLPRLFEFTFGMALAYWQFEGKLVLERMVGGGKAVGFLLLSMAGFALDTFQSGWIFSDLVIGVGLFGLLINLSAWIRSVGWTEKLFRFLGHYSYEIYLVHGFWLSFVFLPFLDRFGLKNELGFWLFLPIFWVIIILASLLNRKIEKKLAI